jgi:hypothetical protein
MTKNMFFFYTKYAILTRRSSVLSLSLQLGFPEYTNRESLGKIYQHDLTIGLSDFQGNYKNIIHCSVKMLQLLAFS